MLKVNLLIIDPQNDFCDIDTNHFSNRPALPVKGSNNDMKRLSYFIEKNLNKISSILITLDSHYRKDISLSSFWKTIDGIEVKPFTLVKSDHIKYKRIIPKENYLNEYVFNYIKTLENNNLAGLTVWPVHCQIGTWGHNIHDILYQTCIKWEKYNFKKLDILLKGLDPLIEQYSAVLEEISTNLELEKKNKIENNKVLSFIKNSDVLIIAGEASSHCVRKTLEDILKYFDDSEIKKITLLSDCMSPVSGFEKDTNTFFLEIQKKGINISKSDRMII